jgi:hypothetical protein
MDNTELLLKTHKREGVCGEMSWKQRLTGWAVCIALGKFLKKTEKTIFYFFPKMNFSNFFIGWLLSILSFIFLITGKKDAVKTSIIYSIGNLMNILA